MPLNNFHTPPHNPVPDRHYVLPIYMEPLANIYPTSLGFPLLSLGEYLSIMEKMVMARFTRTTSLLLRSGIPLLETLKLIRQVISSSNMMVIIDKAHDKIQ